MTKGLTVRDYEVLRELAAANRSDRPGFVTWARPLDVGGTNGSDHSYRLAKLERAGLAESRQRGALGGLRGSKEYRITDQGEQALEPVAA